MDMNQSCLPPNQPQSTDDQKQHPRYAEYQQYLSAMNRQLVTGCRFAIWLEQTEQHERGFETVYEVPAGARMPKGWWNSNFKP